MNKFSRCISNPKHIAQVFQDLTKGDELGLDIRETPLLVYGECSIEEREQKSELRELWRELPVKGYSNDYIIEWRVNPRLTVPQLVRVYQSGETSSIASITRVKVIKSKKVVEDISI